MVASYGTNIYLMFNNEVCSKCSSSARRKCSTCNSSFRSSDIHSHIEDPSAQTVEKNTSKVNSELKTKIIEAIEFRIQIIDQCYNEITQVTKQATEETERQGKIALQKISYRRNVYANLLQEVNHKILDNHVKKIEEIINSVIIYEKPGPIDHFLVWIQQDFIRVRPLKYFPWAENDLRGIQIQPQAPLISPPPKRFVKITSLESGSWAYEGDVENDLPNGEGSFKSPAGAIYSGAWTNGLKEGFCIARLANGCVYEGEWKNDLKEGKGVYRYPSGAIYEGNYVAGKKEGTGVYMYADDSWYTGEWKSNFKEGLGIYMYASGAMYEGEWRRGKAEGKGVYQYPDGTVYEGQWSNDLREGNGREDYPDGGAYQGEFRGDLKEGWGVYKGIDGALYEGNWACGERDGTGTATFADGSVYEGQWKNDVCHGQGRITQSNGDVWEGMWLDGERIDQVIKEANENEDEA